MKLYYSPGACSLAPHIVLRETGADFTLDKIDNKAKKTEGGGDFLAVNPKGYVPTLQLDDGDVLTEGVVIQQFLADQKPGAKLAPAAGTRERRKLDEMLVFLSTEVHKGHSPLFSPTTPDDAKPAIKDKIGQRYDLLQKSFADGRPYVMGQDFTVADAYLFTLTNWSKYVGMDLAAWPALASHSARVAARPAVQAALKAEGLIPA